MPKGTRVHRCVNKLKKKGTYSRAIAICQKATKQSYMTGKTLKKKITLKKRRKTKRRKRRKTKRRKGGVAKRPPRFNAAAMNAAKNDPNWRIFRKQLGERENELDDLETKLEKKKWCEDESANYNIQQLRTDIQKKRIEIESAKEDRDEHEALIMGPPSPPQPARPPPQPAQPAQRRGALAQPLHWLHPDRLQPAHGGGARSSNGIRKRRKIRRSTRRRKNRGSFRKTAKKS